MKRNFRSSFSLHFFRDGGKKKSNNPENLDYWYFYFNKNTHLEIPGYAASWDHIYS